MQRNRENYSFITGADIYQGIITDGVSMIAGKRPFFHHQYEPFPGGEARRPRACIERVRIDPPIYMVVHPVTQNEADKGIPGKVPYGSGIVPIKPVRARKGDLENNIQLAYLAKIHGKTFTTVSLGRVGAKLYLDHE